MKTRPLEISEYKNIINLMTTGFTYRAVEGQEKIFRPNIPIALALQLQASLGLRIGDILDLKLSNFKNGKLEIKEDKTDKLQYRDIDVSIIQAIYKLSPLKTF